MIWQPILASEAASSCIGLTGACMLFVITENKSLLPTVSIKTSQWELL